MTGITSTSASIPPGYNGGYARLTLDELAIYDAVLAPADIIALYTRFGAEFDAAEVVESDAAGLTLPLLSIKEDITCLTRAYPAAASVGRPPMRPC